MTPDLFSTIDDNTPQTEHLSAGTVLLRQFAGQQNLQLLESLDKLLAIAPLRQMFTPGGLPMSVAMSNCGTVGWISDRYGYRYSATDPDRQQPWPAMPETFLQLAQTAAAAAGFAGFMPDACLINRYDPGSKMSLHQDKDELDLAAPIVSVSLGLPAVFLLGGMQRNDKTQKLLLKHGDVLVWGAADRLRFHGVMPVKPGYHELLGPCRFNLTFRKTR
jgi:alkylated DNA repair protein (DNA oxidative demethylase)